MCLIKFSRSFSCVFGLHKLRGISCSLAVKCPSMFTSLCLSGRGDEQVVLCKVFRLFSMETAAPEKVKKSNTFLGLGDG